MKQCPQCRTTYTDDTLRFCLSDGTPLTAVPGAGEAETVISYNPAKPVVIDIPQEKTAFTPGPSYPPPSAAPPEKRGVSPLVVTAIVGLLLLVIAALGALVLYQVYSDKNTAAVNNNTATPTPAASKTPAPGKSPVNANANTAPPLSGTSTKVTAYSPGDGYLVLRSQPNTTSTEMTRIPHGSELTLVSCKGYTTTKAGNYGRWCTASYNGLSGWVFDAFVKY